MPCSQTHVDKLVQAVAVVGAGRSLFIWGCAGSLSTPDFSIEYISTL
ncbi:hypothetical protein G7A79_23320 [Coprococcus sp. MSK.21.13]|nr:hypothetical protein [Coprococcus sp. MSK.21.13]